MRLIGKATICIVVFVVILLVWAPWITDDFAVNRIIEELGGPEAHFRYLHQDMAIKDIPVCVNWLPFGRYVTFPGEAGWYINFFGRIN